MATSIKHYKTAARIAESRWTNFLRLFNKYTQTPADNVNLFNSLPVINEMKNLLNGIDQSTMDDKTTIDFCFETHITRETIHQAAYTRQVYHEMNTLNNEDQGHKYARLKFLEIESAFNALSKEVDEKFSKNQAVHYVFPRIHSYLITRSKDSLTSITKNARKSIKRRIKKQSNFLQAIDNCSDDVLDECLEIAEFRKALDCCRNFLSLTEYAVMAYYFKKRWEEDFVITNELNPDDNMKNSKIPFLVPFSMHYAEHDWNQCLLKKLVRTHREEKVPPNIPFPLARLAQSLVFLTIDKIYFSIMGWDFLHYLRDDFKTHYLQFIKPKVEKGIHPSEIIIDWSIDLEITTDEQYLLKIFNAKESSVLNFAKKILTWVYKIEDKNIVATDLTKAFKAALTGFYMIFEKEEELLNIIGLISLISGKSLYNTKKYIGYVFFRSVLFICLIYGFMFKNQSKIQLTKFEHLFLPFFWKESFPHDIFHTVGLFLYI